MSDRELAKAGHRSAVRPAPRRRRSS